MATAPVKFTVKPALGALAGSEIKATGKVVGESNTDFTLDLLRKLKVGHLVDQLAARDDVDCPANEMRLVINGKTINSDPSKTLLELKVAAGTLIQVVQRQNHAFKDETSEFQKTVKGGLPVKETEETVTPVVVKVDKFADLKTAVTSPTVVPPSSSKVESVGKDGIKSTLGDLDSAVEKKIVAASSKKGPPKTLAVRAQGRRKSFEYNATTGTESTTLKATK